MKTTHVEGIIVITHNNLMDFIKDIRRRNIGTARMLNGFVANGLYRQCVTAVDSVWRHGHAGDETIILMWESLAAWDHAKSLPNADINDLLWMHDIAVPHRPGEWTVKDVRRLDAIAKSMRPDAVQPHGDRIAAMIGKASIEFMVGGKTVWVETARGNSIRIQTTHKDGVTLDDECTNNVAHLDVQTHEPIRVCVPSGA